MTSPDIFKHYVHSFDLGPYARLAVRLYAINGNVQVEFACLYEDAGQAEWIQGETLCIPISAMDEISLALEVAKSNCRALGLLPTPMPAQKPKKAKRRSLEVIEGGRRS